MLEVMNHKIIQNFCAPMSLNGHNRVEVGLVSLRGDSARAGFLIWADLAILLHPLNLDCIFVYLNEILS